MAIIYPYGHGRIREDPTTAEGWMHRMDPTEQAFGWGIAIGLGLIVLSIIIALIGKYYGWWLSLPFPQLH